MLQSRSRSISNDYALLNGGNYRVEMSSRGSGNANVLAKDEPARNARRTVSPREFLARGEQEDSSLASSVFSPLLSAFRCFSFSRWLETRSDVCHRTKLNAI